MKGKEEEPEEREYFRCIEGVRYRYDYDRLLRDIDIAARGFRKEEEGEGSKRAAYQHLCRTDLFFLLHFGMGREDINDEIGAQFVVDRCSEAQRDRNNTLDLWAREHFKSSIVTCARTIQDVLIDPESTTGIFSHNRPIAKGFLDTIRMSLESPRLVSWFPEILWENPRSAKSWGLDSGITVKRKSARPEATVEAWGLVDSMPTSRHFKHRKYDDVVDADTVSNPEQIKKAKEMFRMSHSLKQRGEDSTISIVGTRYHYDDPYGEMIAMGKYTLRLHTVYGGEKTEGIPVLFSEEEVAQRLEDHGPYIFNCQYLLNPVPEGEQKLKVAWVEFYDNAAFNMNVYIIADPANEKKRDRKHDPDYTVIWVIGFGPRGYIYVLDGIRARLDLEERWQTLKGFVKKWNPKCVGWEKYSKDADIQHFEYRMNQERFRFKIVPLGGSLGKQDRIKRLVPIMSQGRLLFPRDGIIITDIENNRRVNLVDILINEEMSTWPYSKHDDMLDCLSRLEDRDQLGVIEAYEEEDMNVQQQYVEQYINVGMDEDTLL